MSDLKDLEKIIKIERKGTGKKKQIKEMSHIIQENQVKLSDSETTKVQPSFQ
jgi:hypothetical protein